MTNPKKLVCQACGVAGELVLERTDGSRIAVMPGEGFIPFSSTAMWHPDEGYTVHPNTGIAPRTEDTLVCLACGAEGLATGYELLKNPPRAIRPEKKVYWHNGVAPANSLRPNAIPGECHCGRFFQERVDYFGEHCLFWHDTMQTHFVGESKWVRGGHCPDCGDKLLSEREIRLQEGGEPE